MAKTSDQESSPPGSLKRLVSGLGWNTIGQFLVISINLGLTPFLLQRLGATQYGVFVFVGTIRGLISNLDAGLGPTGYRYFPVYVGRRNVGATTSLLFTMMTLAVIIVGAETAAMIILAPSAGKIFSLGSGFAGYSHEMSTLIREMMPALLIAAVRTPMQRLVMAHHRWAFINYTEVIAVVASTVTTVAFALKTSGLQCLIWGSYAQEAVLLVTIVWACRQYIDAKYLRWLPGAEVRQILRFGSRIQIAALASSLNNETDTLMMGFLFPAKYVAYYGIGANFSQQVINMSYNALNPIAQDVGQQYGTSGKNGVLRSFADIQRKWVSIIGVFPLAAAIMGWFGIRAWIGDGGGFAATTATVLVLGTAPLMYNAIVDVTAKAVEMPEIESWYLGIGVAINLACTIPLALRDGAIGIPLGTGIGQVISFVVCIALARRRIGKEITPFFRDIRYVPGLFAVALVGICEFSFSHHLPGGGVGFVLSGLLTLPGFIVYYGWVYREPLLARFGSQPQPAVADQRQDAHDEESAYARRQLRGVQALIAMAEPDITVRQLRGLEALMALAEPDMSVLPYPTGSARFHYTGPLPRYDERPLDQPPPRRPRGRE